MKSCQSLQTIRFTLRNFAKGYKRPTPSIFGMEGGQADGRKSDLFRTHQCDGVSQLSLF